MREKIIFKTMTKNWQTAEYTNESKYFNTIITIDDEKLKII